MLSSKHQDYKHMRHFFKKGKYNSIDIRHKISVNISNHQCMYVRYTKFKHLLHAFTHVIIYKNILLLFLMYRYVTNV